MDTLSAIAGRLWEQDRLASVIALSMAFLQVMLLVFVTRKTLWPIWRAGDFLRDLGRKVSDDRNGASRLVARLGGRVGRAWRLAIPRTEADADRLSAMSPEEAFAPSQVLPEHYNPRLDSAAPGVFTAIGILGTFIGLIIGFSRVNPDVATMSVSPILGGMVVAFGNSAVGVLLSIVWTIFSRIARHRFDLACESVADAIGKRTARPSAKAMLYGSLTRIESQLEHLAAATNNSSRDLLANLSESVGDSVRRVVELPFENLKERVGELGELIHRTAEQQMELHSRLTTTGEQVERIHLDLGKALDASREIVSEFNSSTLGLTASAQVLGGIASSMEGSAKAFEAGASNLSPLADALQRLGDAIGKEVGALATSADRFEKASDRLETAVATIQNVSMDAAKESAASVQLELQGAIQLLNEGLTRLSESTIAAYEASTGRVITTVDDRVSDLTDRMSAELTTLSQRLPEQVETLNAATRRIQQQLERATSSIDRSLVELSDRTPAALRAQLEEFDRLLGRAMDHFSGTLNLWDGRVAELTTHSRAFEQLASRLLKNGGDGADGPRPPS